MGTDQTLGERAYQKLLLHEGEVETGKNRGPIVKWAVEKWVYPKDINKFSVPWCAGAVCTAYVEAGSIQIKQIGSLSVDVLFKRLKQKNQVVFPSSSLFSPQCGDLVFFGTEKDLYHVGMVKKYHPNSKTLETIEGNHKDGVFQTIRKEYYAIGTILF